MRKRKQIGGGNFPIHIGTFEWVSGYYLWSLDVVAADWKLVAAGLTNLARWRVIVRLAFADC